MTSGAVSWAMETTWDCDACGAENTIAVWSILSSVDQPALVDQLASTGSIGSPCHRCGNIIEADHAILVHRADRWGSTVLAYSPVSPAVAPIETASQMAEGLATILLASLGIADPSHEVIIVMVPRLALPNLLVRDVRADARTSPGQLRLPADIAESYRHALSRLRQRMGYA